MTAPTTGELPPPAMERGLRGAMSGTLILEGIVLLLALPVASQQGAGTVGIVAILVLAFAHVLWCMFVTRPWFLVSVMIGQALVIAGWVFSPALGIMGIVFALAWATLIWFRNEFRRRWAAGTLPIQQAASQQGE